MILILAQDTSAEKVIRPHAHAQQMSHMVAERHYDATTAGRRKPSEKEHDETMIDQKERTKAYVQQAADARDYIIVLETEFRRIYVGILALMDENLIPPISTGEPKAFCFEKDDYFRSLTECTTGNAKSKTVDVSMVSSEVSQKSYCDEEMSQATEKEDLEADAAKHSSKLETAEARSIFLDGEISALQQQLQCVDKMIDVPIVSVVQVPRVCVVEKTTEIPVTTQRQNHMVQTVQMPMETPQLQIVEKTIETTETQTIQGTQTSESLGTALVCRVAQARTVKVVKIETLFMQNPHHPCSSQHQFRRPWRNSLRHPRFSLRTRFNSILENRPLKLRLLHSLR